MYRVLVTGSRSWTDWSAISARLAEAVGSRNAGSVVIVHGACPRGADAIADRWAHGRGIAVERHPADWQRYGSAAGPRRNAEMVAAGADLCLAFILDGSRGATHCAEAAERAGIPVWRAPASGTFTVTHDSRHPRGVRLTELGG